MKFLYISLLSIFSLIMMGCVSNEQPQYIGTIPTYANKPHPVTCGCCSNITMLRVVNGQIRDEWSMKEADFNKLMLEDSTKILFK